MIFSYYLKSTFFLLANGCFIKKKINFEDQYMVHIAVLKKNRFNDYWEIRDQMVELRKKNRCEFPSMSKVLSQLSHFLPHLTRLSMREISEVRNSLHVKCKYE